MNKTVGYIFGALGLIVFALSYPAARTALGIAIPGNIGDIYVSLIGVALLLAGAFLLFKSSKGDEPKEIPIYEGHGKHRKLVGIQRVKG